jgi:hypothetical protein
MHTLGQIVIPWQQHNSISIRKVHVYPKFIAINKDFHPTHDNLVECDVLVVSPHSFHYIQDKNSNQDGNRYGPIVGISLGMLLVMLWKSTRFKRSK